MVMLPLWKEAIYWTMNGDSLSMLQLSLPVFISQHFQLTCFLEAIDARRPCGASMSKLHWGWLACLEN